MHFVIGFNKNVIAFKFILKSSVAEKLMKGGVDLGMICNKTRLKRLDFSCHIPFGSKYQQSADFQVRVRAAASLNG